MDLIHAKGSGFYGQDNVTLMQPQSVVDVVKTQQRYQDAIYKVNTRYLQGEITQAQKQELVKQAEFERLCTPQTVRVQNQKTLDKVRVQPVGDRQEQGFLTGFNSVDFEVGIDVNNFELRIGKIQSMSLGIELGDYIYIPDTEFGGIIDGRTIDTASDEIIWTGTTWRGLLQTDIIRPLNPATDAFRIVSGDVNDILREVLAENEGSGAFFDVPSGACGVTVSNYQFPRYINKLKGLKDMLASVNCKLKLWADNTEIGGQFKVWCSAVPVVNYSQEIEYSQDTNKVDVKMSQNYSVVNHLICLGAGELTERTVIDLYVDKEGKITQERPVDGFFGVHERTEVFDYGSVEGETATEKKTNLLVSGLLQLASLNEVNSMELTVDDMPAEVGDIIAGKDRTTGIEMQKAITNKILRIDANGKATIELNVNGQEGEYIEYN